MKTMKILVLSVFMMALTAGTSFAYLIDGDPSDWGITPFTDWTPDSWTVDWVEEDNWNPQEPVQGADYDSDPFNERWDLEAMYFDDDDDYFYFGIVTSNPYEHNWAKEDLAIDLDGDDFPEYGLDVANLEGDQLEWRGVYSVEDWREFRDVPYRMDDEDQIGQYQIYQKYLGDIEPDLGQPGGYYGHTYFLEMKVNRALFGNIPCGTPINILFSRVTCLKDWFMVNGCTNGNCPPGVIPEPATLFLLGAGLFGIAGSRRRKK